MNWGRTRSLPRWILGTGVWLLALLMAFPVLASGLRRSAIVKAVEQASPAVVNVSTEQTVDRRFNPFWGFPGDSFFNEFFRDFLSPFPRSETRTSLGSGVIIDPRGYILTNEHVVQGASMIRVTLADQREFTAKLIGADPPSDLAVLRIDAQGELPVMAVGQSDDLMIGETVVAIGNPFGLSHTVTTGVISALNRSVRTQQRVYHDFIQTDAAINPGNSGGPLLNIDGELIGINTAIYQKAQGVGFAIPIDRAKHIVQDLIHYGEVQPAWIGLDLQNLDDQLAQYFNLKGKHGVLVTQVSPGGPADKAGLRKGDLITAIGRTPVTSREDFSQALATYTARSTIYLTLWSKGKEKTVSLKAAALSPEQALKEAEARLGITVSAITPSLRGKYGLETKQGVMVASVQPESLAHRVGIRPGDVIRQINEQEVTDLKGFEKAMARALRRDNILLLIQRGPYGYYLTLELGGG